MAKEKVIRCLGCGEGWEDAQEFEKDGGTVQQIGIAMVATCECGRTFPAVALLEASRLRRQREKATVPKKGESGFTSAPAGAHTDSQRASDKAAEK